MFERLINAIVDFINFITSAVGVIVIIGLIILVILVVVCALTSKSKSNGEYAGTTPRRYQHSTTPKNYRRSTASYYNHSEGCCGYCEHARNIGRLTTAYCSLYDLDVKTGYVCNDCISISQSVIPFDDFDKDDN